MSRLSSAERTLLDDVLRRRAARLEGVAIGDLSADDVRNVQLAIADELTATGLRPDDEPNERGYVLEELLNAVLRETGALPPRD